MPFCSHKPIRFSFFSFNISAVPLATASHPRLPPSKCIGKKISHHNYFFIIDLIALTFDSPNKLLADLFTYPFILVSISIFHICFNASFSFSTLVNISREYILQ